MRFCAFWFSNKLQLPKINKKHNIINAYYHLSLTFEFQVIISNQKLKTIFKTFHSQRLLSLQT